MNGWDYNWANILYPMLSFWAKPIFLGGGHVKLSQFLWANIKFEDLKTKYTNGEFQIPLHLGSIQFSVESISFFLQFDSIQFLNQRNKKPIDLVDKSGLQTPILPLTRFHLTLKLAPID